MSVLYGNIIFWSIHIYYHYSVAFRMLGKSNIIGQGFCDDSRKEQHWINELFNRAM